MSGRVRTVVGGRWVTGYRKTERVVVSRRKGDEMPDWRARFVVPDRIGFAVAVGKVRGLVGAEITQIGHAIVGEITGKNRAWVLRQADALAHAIGFHDRPFFVVLKRDPWPSFTVSGPFGRGDDGVVEIAAGGKAIEGNVMRSIRAER